MKLTDSVKIVKCPHGDSRTADTKVTFEQFMEANRLHMRDVSQLMYKLSRVIDLTGKGHDFSKVTMEEEFYDNFIDTLHNGTDFVSNTWYQKHIAEERHHLLSRCPEDVNLIDVLEMIVDCVAAGRARSGELRPIELNQDILNRAVQNTVKLVDSMVEVVEYDK